MVEPGGTDVPSSHDDVSCNLRVPRPRVINRVTKCAPIINNGVKIVISVRRIKRNKKPLKLKLLKLRLRAVGSRSQYGD